MSDDNEMEELQRRMNRLLGLRAVGKAVLRPPAPKEVFVAVRSENAKKKLIAFKSMWNSILEKDADDVDTQAERGKWAAKHRTKKSLRSFMHNILAREFTKMRGEEDEIRKGLAKVSPKAVDDWTIRVKPKIDTPHEDGRPWVWTICFTNNAPRCMEDSERQLPPDCWAIWQLPVRQ